MTPTVRGSLDRDLATIRDEILRMGELVDIAIKRAMKALETQDRELAQNIIEADSQINDLRFDVEESSVALIATQQPVATDLRAIVAAMNIVLDLERMGDHAAGVAKTVLLMDSDDPLEIPNSLNNIMQLARDMVRQILKAYAENDTETAYEISGKDDLVDEQYKSLFQDLLDQMVSDPENTQKGLYLLFTGHNLERIADRATNIAERVVFMTSGYVEELNVSEPPEASLGG